MRRRIPNPAVLLLAFAVALAMMAPTALAGWVSQVDAGAQSLSTATLAAPTGVAAARGACTQRKPKQLTIVVSWTPTTSPQATGYAVLRGTASGGPFTQVGIVAGINTSSWTDATKQLAFGTTYYYVVEATVQSWSSPASTPGSVTTPNNRCV
jgi:hypothetical protein